eukprot:jgi/Mesvir1/13182/Mv06144-RA.2
MAACARYPARPLPLTSISSDRSTVSTLQGKSGCLQARRGVPTCPSARKRSNRQRNSGLELAHAPNQHAILRGGKPGKGQGSLPCFAVISGESGSETAAVAPGKAGSQTAQQALKGKSPVLVLPGFLSSSSQYAELVENLRCLQGVEDVRVVDMSAWDWVPSLFGSSFTFYLDKAAQALEAILADHPNEKINLVAHSAGGWLARLLILEDISYDGRRYGFGPHIGSLITLGTPHYSVEEYPFGRVPEKRKDEEGLELTEEERTRTLQLVNRFWSGEEARERYGITSVAVCGRVIHGKPWGAGTWDEFLAGDSYKNCCRKREVWGDGVTPLESALLEDAEHLILEGVHHSARQAKRFDGESRLWYGSVPVIEQWGQFLQ